MAATRQSSPAGLRVAAIALGIGGLVIGIGLPLALTILKIKTTDIAPGVDLMLILLPVIGIIDLVVARVLWRRANASEPDRRGPVVG